MSFVHIKMDGLFRFSWVNLRTIPMMFADVFRSVSRLSNCSLTLLEVKGHIIPCAFEMWKLHWSFQFKRQCVFALFQCHRDAIIVFEFIFMQIIIFATLYDCEMSCFPACTAQVEKVCSVTTEEHLQPFKDQMETFVSEGERPWESQICPAIGVTEVWLVSIKLGNSWDSSHQRWNGIPPSLLRIHLIQRHFFCRGWKLEARFANALWPPERLSMRFD